MNQIKKEAPEDEEFANWIRKFYNNKVKIKNKGDYEHHRWFSSKNKRRQFKFTTQSLNYHFRDINFKNCLEIGCGPGTWTRFLLKKYANSKFTCLDISKEMISQFKEKSKDKRIKFIVNHFTDENFKDQKFDFIFSSRAIEYIPNKKKVLEKIYSLLGDGKSGMIITSHPHPTSVFFKKLVRKRINLQHTRRISVKRMKALLKGAGFTNIHFYPILFTDAKPVPTALLFKTFYKKKWGFFSKAFATGYVVKFEKPRK